MEPLVDCLENKLPVETEGVVTVQAGVDVISVRNSKLPPLVHDVGEGVKRSHPARLNVSAANSEVLLVVKPREALVLVSVSAFAVCSDSSRMPNKTFYTFLSSFHFGSHRGCFAVTY